MKFIVAKLHIIVRNSIHNFTDRKKNHRLCTVTRWLLTLALNLDDRKLILKMKEKKVGKKILFICLARVIIFTLKNDKYFKLIS